jgi:hypothetical protein
MVDSLKKAEKTIELYFSKKDIENFNTLFPNSIEFLLSKIQNWNLFFRNGKHEASSLDEYGYSVLKSMVLTKIFHNYKTKKGLYNFSFGNDLKEKGYVIIENHPIFKPEFLKELEEFIHILEGKPAKFTPRYSVNHTEGSKNNTHLHIDSLYPCFRIFYYLEDTNLENGPFSFVPYSHKISFEKLKFLKESSIKRSADPSLDPALRVEGQSLNYFTDIESPVEAKEHTLIIANTSGIHRRYPPSPNFSRALLRSTFNRESIGDIIL